MTHCWYMHLYDHYKSLDIAWKQGVLVLNSFMARAPETTFLGDISLTKLNFRKCLMEKYSSEANQELSLKYFSNLWLILKLFSKVS